jgi:predicted nucleic acid-binding protein
MTFLLDTNIISEISRPQPDDKVVGWLQAHRGQCALTPPMTVIADNKRQSGCFHKS